MDPKDKEFQTRLEKNLAAVKQLKLTKEQEPKVLKPLFDFLLPVQKHPERKPKSIDAAIIKRIAMLEYPQDTENKSFKAAADDFKKRPPGEIYQMYADRGVPGASDRLGTVFFQKALAKRLTIQGKTSRDVKLNLQPPKPREPVEYDPGEQEADEEEVDLITPAQSKAPSAARSELTEESPGADEEEEYLVDEEAFTEIDPNQLDKDQEAKERGNQSDESGSPDGSPVKVDKTVEPEEADENTVLLDADEISARYGLLRNTISSTTKEIFVLEYLQKRKRGIPVPTHVHALCNRILQLLRGRGILQYTDFPKFAPSGDYDVEEWENAEAILFEYLTNEVTLVLYSIINDTETKEELRDARLILLERLAEEELIAEELLTRKLNKERAERAAEREARKAKQAERDAMVAAARAAGKKAAQQVLQKSPSVREKIRQLREERDKLIDQLPTLGPQLPSTLDPSFRARMMLIYMQQVQAYKKVEAETAIESVPVVTKDEAEIAANEMLISLVKAQRLRRTLMQQTYLAEVEATMYFGEDDEANIAQQLAEIDGLLEQDIPITDDDFLDDIAIMFIAAQEEADLLPPDVRQALNDSIKILNEKVTVSPDDIDVTFTEEPQESDTLLATPANTPRGNLGLASQSYTQRTSGFGTRVVGDQGEIARRELTFDEPGGKSKDETIRRLQQEVNDLRQELVRMREVASEAQQLYDKLFYDMIRIQDVNETARKMDAEFISKLRVKMAELTPRRPGKFKQPTPISQAQAATQTWTPLHIIRHQEYPETPQKSGGVRVVITPQKQLTGPIESGASEQTAYTRKAFSPRPPLAPATPVRVFPPEKSPAAQELIDNSKALTVRISQVTRNLAMARSMTPGRLTQGDLMGAQQLYIDQLKNELLELRGQVKDHRFAIRDVDRPEAQNQVAQTRSNFLALEDNRAARVGALQISVIDTQLALNERRDNLTDEGNRELNQLQDALTKAANDLVKLEKLRLQQLEFYMSLDQERQEQIDALKGKAPSRLAQEAAKRANEEQARNQKLREEMKALEDRLELLTQQQQQTQAQPTSNDPAELKRQQDLLQQQNEQLEDLRRQLGEKTAELETAKAEPKATPKRLKQAINRANEEQARNQELRQQIEEVGRARQEAENKLAAERQRQAEKPVTGKTPEKKQENQVKREQIITTLENKLDQQERRYQRTIARLEQSNLDLVRESDEALARLQADRETDAQTIRNLIAQTQAQGNTIQFQAREAQEREQEQQRLVQENIDLQANIERLRAEKRAASRAGSAATTPRQTQNNPLGSNMGSRSQQSFTASQRGAGINPTPSFVGATPSMTPVFAPNRPQVRDSRDTSNASRFAQKVSRFFETAAPGTNNTTFAFNSYDTFLNAMATYGIEAVDLTSDTSYLEDIVTSFYSGQVARQDMNTLIASARAAGAWPLKYQPKYSDQSNLNTRSVAFMNRSLGQVVNSDMGTIFVGGAPSASIRRQGLNYVVSGPRGEKAVFGTARDAQYYSSSKGKRYGPVTESVFGYKPKNLSQAIY